MATILCLAALFVALLLSTTNCAKYAPETLPKAAYGGQTPFYTPEEMYIDIFPLTRGNFTAKVLKSKDPWIILFHDGTSLKSWKTMAVKLRGIVWVGAIHRSEQEDLLGRIVSPGTQISLFEKNVQYEAPIVLAHMVCMPLTNLVDLFKIINP
jgi:hypothetical protein